MQVANEIHGVCLHACTCSACTSQTIMTVCIIFIGMQGYTPLHIATLYGHETIVEMLLKAGANPSPVSEVSIILPEL